MDERKSSRERAKPGFIHFKNTVNIPTTMCRLNNILVLSKQVQNSPSIEGVLKKVIRGSPKKGEILSSP